MEQQIGAITSFVDTIIEFLVTYGFQILGALVVLFIGLKLAGWSGRKVTELAAGKDIDSTLAKFIGNVCKLVLIVFVVIITLGNFGITIAPLIALAGASAFGATLAIQGPLSNYGAGLSIILSRPFVVGDTITVADVSGVVDEIALAATVLLGEDGERIRIPNKEIIGQVITNSQAQRVVQTKVCIGHDEDTERAIEVLRKSLADIPEVNADRAPQIGVHDFTYGGIILGLRFWVPSQRYFQVRYVVNRAALDALTGAGIKLQATANTAIAVPSLSGDAEPGSGWRSGDTGIGAEPR
jgi:small conductance mechanosensitive channel